MENTFYVYLHRRKTDNKVFYVGKGKGKRSDSVYSRSEWWKSTVEKHGLIIEIAFDGLSEEEAFQCEKDTISEFRYFGHPLVNLTDGGEGMCGHKPSQGTLVKRAEKLRGKKRTPEQCKRISESITGRKLSPSVVDGMVKRRIGSKRSEESIQKTAESNRGKKRTAEQRIQMSGLNHSRADLTAYTFREQSSGEIFVGTRFDFATHIGTKASNISGFFRKVKPSKTISNWRVILNETEKKTEEH